MMKMKMIIKIIKNIAYFLSILTFLILFIFNASTIVFGFYDYLLCNLIQLKTALKLLLQYFLAGYINNDLMIYGLPEEGVKTLYNLSGSLDSPYMASSHPIRWGPDEEMLHRLNGGRLGDR